MQDTKTVILDAAERCFAREGIDRASIRTITGMAGVNLGAITYHFGSKENLVMAVLAHRMTPLNQERLALLDAFEQEAGDNPAAVRDILTALVQPLLDLRENHPEYLDFSSHFINWVNEGCAHQMRSQFGEIQDRFLAAFARALPHLSEKELAYRYAFIVTQLVSFQSNKVQQDILANHLGLDLDPLEQIGLLIFFLEGALSAPASLTA